MGFIIIIIITTTTTSTSSCSIYVIFIIITISSTCDCMALCFSLFKSVYEVVFCLFVFLLFFFSEIINNN